MTEAKGVCPYCKEPIEMTAVKCKHCLEFLPNYRQEKIEKTKRSSDQLTISSFELIGKALIPVTILIIALLFKPTLEYLLIKAQTAEFLGTKISFSESRSYSGDLKPLELFYLMFSANNYGKADDSHKSKFNFDLLVKDGHDAVFSSLENKGLIEFHVIDNKPTDPEAFGKQSLVSTPTDKGKAFLIELGLQFDGKTFTDAP